jgi:peptidoglycan/LPS O-acetylase OafA/YrhL
MRYRPAIDGLRALAVSLVLLYHAKAQPFSGGYIGVDVFFVISGYLITSVIRHEDLDGRFSLSRFYERRVRRIFPAFIIVTFTTLVAGATLLLPPDAARVGSGVVAATLFLSNVYFWRVQKQDYLLDERKYEPLLHTWSLSIEEQFYLVFPIVMLLVRRVCSERRLPAVFLASALSSFSLSVYLTSAHPGAAFYFMPSRAWELLLGAWIAVTPVSQYVPRRFEPLLQTSGLALILVAATGYSNLTPFPGLAALVPCLGAALIIGWSDRHSLVIRGLSHPLVVGVGLISYPLYLWHWPLLILGRLVWLRELRASEVLAVYVLAVILSVATWRYIERPFRARPSSFSARKMALLGAGAAFLLVTTGGILKATEGSRLASSPRVAQMLAKAKDYAPSFGPCHNWGRQGREQLRDCTIGDAVRPAFDFALWGDSHAGALAFAMDAAAKNRSRKGLQLTVDNCPPLLATKVTVRQETRNCEALNIAGLALIQQLRIRQVFLSGQWIQYIAGKPDIVIELNDAGDSRDPAVVFQRAVIGTIDRLHGMGIDIVMIGPVPEMGWDVPPVLAALEWRGKPWPQGPSQLEFMNRQRKILDILKTVATDHVNVEYPHELLCASTCLYELNGQILYSDAEHLSTQGAQLLQPSLARLLN